MEYAQAVRNWKLFLIAGFAAFVLAAVWLSQRAGRTPLAERLLETVPTGSGIGELERVAQHERVSGGEVMQWIRSTKTVPDREDIQLRVGGATNRTDFGVFELKDLGDYTDWNPSADDAEGFTGEIVFFVDQPFGNSSMVGFSYVDGRLVKKDWGYLPG